MLELHKKLASKIVGDELHGHEVATLVNEQKESGNYEVTFDDSHTERSHSIASDVCIYQLNAGNFTQTKRLLMMK